MDKTQKYAMFLLQCLPAKTSCELQLKTSLNLLILQLKLFAQQQAIF